MREIRFRAWDKIGNKIVRWNQLVKYNLSNVLINPDICGLQLMQYTGLKDKNGKEIYEGDIIKYHYDNEIYKFINAKVIFNTGRFMLRANENGFAITRNMYISHSEDIEIIGNIFENIELLEVEDNGK